MARIKQTVDKKSDKYYYIYKDNKMIHSIEDLIRRINVMHDKAVELHRVRNQYSNISGKTYDKDACKYLIDDIQELALGIAMDSGNKVDRKNPLTEPTTQIKPLKDITMYYRTTNMRGPSLFFEDNQEKYEDKVAVSAVFAPNFEKPDSTCLLHINFENIW